jgi:hypothetical protein
VARQRLTALQAAEKGKPAAPTRDWARTPFLEFADLVSADPLSPAQRVLCKIAFEGKEPRELEGEEWEIAQRLLKPAGQKEPVEVVPKNARPVLTLVKGARIGGTYMSALYAAHRALAANLSTLAPGEQGRVIFGGPKLDYPQQALGYVVGAYESQPDLSALIVVSTMNRLVIGRPDGREVEFVTRAADRGGASFRSRTLVCACLTEAAFFFGADHVANDEDVFRAITPRILPGGLTILESTPFAEAGLLHAEFERNWGHPTTSLAMHAPTMFMLPTERNRVAYENMVATDPENAEREFGAAFIPFGSSVFFPREVLQRCKVAGKGKARAPDAGEIAAVGGDLGLTHDAAAFVAVHRVPDPSRGEQRDPKTDRYRVAECLERRPARGVPLRLGVLVPLAAELALRHGQKSVLVDQWSAQPAREHCPPGFSLETEVRDEAEQYDAALELMKAGQVEIPAEFDALLRQLPLVMSKPTPGGGKKIILPRKFGSHCDLVPAFVKALWKAKGQPVGQTFEQPTNVRQRAFARQRGY